MWKFRLERLKEALHKDVQQTLMISYDALEEVHRQIYLDIACFFNDEKKIGPIYFWEACKFYPNCVINFLEHRSLIKVNDRDKLLMQDQLRDLRRETRQGSRSQISAKPSRLWSLEVALNALRKKEINYSYTCSHSLPFNLEF